MKTNADGLCRFIRACLDEQLLTKEMSEYLLEKLLIPVGLCIIVIKLFSYIKIPGGWDWEGVVALSGLVVYRG